MSVVLFSVIAFTAVIMLLLFAQSKLVNSGDVVLDLNGKKQLSVPAGSSLLSTLSSQKIFLPSACGGGGTCAMCKCVVESGGGDVLPTEEGHLSRSEKAQGVRLACQVKVKENMKIHIHDEIFGIKKWECEVISNYNVA
jgi:Na+-transporting NADH:ubiquinone oxidoreductase subunit F